MRVTDSTTRAVRHRPRVDERDRLTMSRPTISETPQSASPCHGEMVPLRAVIRPEEDHLSRGSRSHNRDRDLRNVRKALMVSAGDASIDAGRRVTPHLRLRSEVDAGK